MSLAEHSHALKRGGLGLSLGIAAAELAVPVVYKIARFLPRKIRKAIYRYSPSHHKSVGVTAMSMGLFTGNPLMIGTGAGLVISDAFHLVHKEKKMMKEAARAIHGHPPIDIHKYDIPDYLPLAWQYSLLGDVLREIVCDETYNRVRRVYVPGGREHPAVLVAARKLISENGLDGHNKQAVLEAIQRYVSSTVNYCYDSRFLDEFFHPYITLMSRAGDCDDQTLLTCSLGEAVGIPMRMKLIGQHVDDPGRYNHIFSQGEVSPGNWVSCETIFKNLPLGWEAPSVSHRIINLD